MLPEIIQVTVAVFAGILLGYVRGYNTGWKNGYIETMQAIEEVNRKG